MIKKRSKMNKIIMWGLIATASVSLASVGFASWVINTITPTNGDNVKVTVGEVKNKSLIAKVNTEGTDLNVAFDNDAEKDTTGGNFVNDDGKKEKLSFTIKTTFETGATQISDVLGGVDFDFTVGTDLQKLINASDSTGATNYIKAPSFIGTDNKSTIRFTWTGTACSSTALVPDKSAYFSTGIQTNSSGAGKTFSFTTTFTFEWGSAFLNVNPNKTTIGSSDSTTALTRSSLETRLAAFRAAYNDKGSFLSVKITPVAK
ncbi:MAG: hypothetical protein MR606_00415 [Mollicutes bacterium]|nr:hypothetical protein [Mollicutes bacterium]MDD7263742.1 hypothetical protein [bacterium]MDY4979802.1 hypothetical protein [Candidatus Onthovivens sp.]